MRFSTLILFLLFVAAACSKDQPASTNNSGQENAATQQVQDNTTAETLIARIEEIIDLTEAQEAQINSIATQYNLGAGDAEASLNFRRQVRTEVLTEEQREAYLANRDR